MRTQAVWAGLLVVVTTLLGAALPASAPLYAQVYPGPDAGTIDEALDEANLKTGFAPRQLTQFEKARFSATIVYGTSTTPTLPTVKVAWSNEAELVAEDEDAFVIVPVTRSRQFLDQGTRRAGGGYTLTWTWTVTPLRAGEQTIILRIRPTVVVEQKEIADLADVNEPIAINVEVNPAKRRFDEVVMSAKEMVTEVPEVMIVGEEHDVSATMSMPGHAGTVTADIALAPAEDSAAVTISEASPQAFAPAVSTESPPGDGVSRRWTVIPEEAGQVRLLFTARVLGTAAEQQLEQDVPVTASARAVAPAPSFWETLQKPVLYLTPFVALAGMLLGLRTAWAKRHPRPQPDGPAQGAPPSDDTAP